ncbi:MAG TPA: sensor histidine kinase [Gemmatimonadales bacterium]|nr:sensor histidine kinase [Gemmatimonadales bacterium]
MAMAAGNREGMTSARVLEKGLRRLLEHPSQFTYGALAISTAIALPGELAAPRMPLAGLASLAAFLIWVRLWSTRRVRDPSGRGITTIALAFAGTLLLASLALRHLSFSLVGATLLPQYFASLPLAAAALAFVPMFIAAEYSHALAILADPAGVAWASAFIRGAAVILVGLCFKVLAIQMDERAVLQASVAAAERRAGVLEERQRLAREIHDTLAQGFAGIAVHLERAEQLDALASSPAKAHVDLARSVAREGLEEARRMLGALRPEILTQRALPEALSRVCEDWSRRSGIAANLSITGASSPMHPDIELTVLRGVQEALTNVARHSGARTAAVTLSYMEDLVVLDVQDDGRGFVPAAGTGTGYGLTGMRERTESLNGEFSVESLLGEGTTISMSLPVLRPAGGEAPAEGVS